jgi:predicted MPP superfamily phosphohydrolase
VGEVMQKVMRAHPTSNLLVLCGHTHGGGELQVQDNLRVLTGEAQYGKPRINRILEMV